MSAVSLENYAEQIEVLLLAGQSGLSGFAIEQENENTAPGVNRITCKASPRAPYAFGKDPMTPKFWKIPVTVTVHLATRDVAAFDTYIAAIQAAHASGASIPAGVTTLATAQFPNGLEVLDSEEGEADHASDVRTRSKVFNYVCEI